MNDKSIITGKITKWLTDNISSSYTIYKENEIEKSIFFHVSSNDNDCFQVNISFENNTYIVISIFMIETFFNENENFTYIMELPECLLEEKLGSVFNIIEGFLETYNGSKLIR